MAAPRDPAFWRRFSMAVHMDEEKSNVPDNTSTSTSSIKKQSKQQQDWLERNHKKSRKIKTIGCLIALLLVILVAALVMLLLWWDKSGPFAPPKSVEKPADS